MKKGKILIVDDDPGILDSLSIILEDEGYITKTTEKEKEVYNIVETFSPDIIILDILMSGNDGRVICKNLKKNHKTRKIPVILISAHPTAVNSTDECEAEEFLAKPFESKTLYDLIEKYI